MSARYVSRIGGILRINDTIIDTHGVVSVFINSCSLCFKKQDGMMFSIFVSSEKQDVYWVLDSVQRELYQMRLYSERKD